ncbi:glycosyltransferase family 2 protein [Chryseobacterium sp.]|uniref:glycosyltransferase family 2 protein n=1 Tax=Chryseobacterium sp. TaxID=1871047 RepID=UPI00289C6241|nr:glycosyltransferase family 2 protein [Chryseobacterium sp.]
MLFSLLIAHYNNFTLFKDCYQSIINQSYGNFEVIILDDCSTDGSYENLQNLIGNDNRFTIYRNPENKGVGYTKKKLVDFANGQICGFVDPDDALTHHAIKKSIDCYFTKEVIATYSKINICDENLNFKKIFPNTYKVKKANPLFFNIQFEISHFFTFRKSAYEKITGINPDLKVAEDMDLYLQLYEIGEIQFIPEALYFYRIHHNGLSHTQEKSKIKEDNWHQVILSATKRRNLNTLYGKKIDDIPNLPKFIYEKQNTFFKRVIKKLS